MKGKNESSLSQFGGAYSVKYPNITNRSFLGLGRTRKHYKSCVMERFDGHVDWMKHSGTLELAVRLSCGHNFSGNTTDITFEN